ncbi:hypothetical protein M408DRAFT_325339 [Serendipita vermifera MAFF 305830]|uniref:Uncharacterized protein n=1 Tax=Serendipita vermifera MAFF 305830 TaxID=933852 RepID=A0A0C3BNR3_SERVB|nr:hypothetical protein M408DRAFT_325339 [Serendipita vermifera MAFF 305830]
MDVDPPARRQETKRSTVPDVYERTSEMRQALPDPPPPPPSRDRRDDRPRAMSSSHPQLPVPPRDRREERPRENQQPQSLPQPPPRDRRDRPAGDREYHHSATASQRTSPPQTLNATEQPAPVPRSRVPLPPQSEAMRLGGKRAPPPPSSSRYAPMDVDTNDTYRPPPSENSNARNVDRSRGRRSRSPPPPRSYDDGGSRPKGGPSGSYDMPPRTDRAMFREPGDSRNGAPSRPPLPPDPYRANQRERPSKPPGPISTSNNIPLSNPKEFGRPAVNQKNDEVASQLDSENARYPQGPPPEQASTTSPAGNETKPSGDSAPKRQRQVYFTEP